VATGQVVAGPVIHLGVVGCGEISAAYFRNLLRLQSVDVVAVADLDLGLAEATARQFGLSRACSVDELFADVVRPKGVTEVVETRERQPELERGLGVGDLVDAIQAGYPHRASREMAGHVLDVMLAIPESATEGRHLTVASTCDRPAPLEAERIQRWLAER